MPAGLRTAQDLIPEAALLAGALLCLGLSAARRDVEARVHAAIAGIAVFAAALFELTYLRGMPEQGWAAYSDGLVIDRYSVFLTVVLCGIALVTVAGVSSLDVRVRPHVGEAHALVLTATLGAVLMVSARELIALWVAVQLLTLSLLGLAGLVKAERRGLEAAARLLVVGGVGSALLLYGLALLYGLTGTTVMTQVAAVLGGPSPALALACGLIVGGMALTLGAGLSPLLGGAADQAPAAGLLTGLGMVAGLGALGRLLVVALPVVSSTWTGALAAAGLAAVAVGSVTALVERRVRRLLGALAVAQAGTMLIAILGWRSSSGGLAALLLAAVSAGLALAAGYAAVEATEASGAGPNLADLRGLSRRSPVVGTALVLAALSLAGAPPLLGFVARILIAQAAVSAGFAWLVVVTSALGVAGVVAAVRLAVAVLVDPEVEEEEAVAETPGLSAALVAASVATALLGVAAGPLISAASAGAGQLH